MPRSLAGVARSVDRHPVAALVCMFASVLGVLVTWDALQHGPVLLANARAGHRVTLYGQIGATAVGVLAVTFTVVAILTALPDAERTRELREARAWGLLEHTLVLTAGFALLTAALALIAAAVDNVPRGREPLEALFLAAATTALVGGVLSGAAFALVLGQIRRPPERRPPEGRGGGFA